MSQQTKLIAEKLKQLNELPKTQNMIPYCLTHTYDEKVRRYYVEAPYMPDVFEAICAYIQFECSEIEETFSMDQTDVIEVLEKFYGCNKIKRTRANQVDLYLNWEWFCGSDIQSVECLKRDGMNVYFDRFIQDFYEARELRREQTVV